jgi:hypothetical protein
MLRNRETAPETEVQGDINAEVNAIDAAVTAQFLLRSAAYLANGGAPFAVRLSTQGLLLMPPIRASRRPGGQTNGTRRPC